MKKFLAIILTIFITFSIGTVMIACNDNTNNKTNQTQELSNEQKVRDRVNLKGRVCYLDSSIGGNDLTKSSVNITNYKWTSEYQCIVSGTMQCTDIYGTIWKNKFDIVVTSSDNGKTWDTSDWEFKGKWTK